MKKFMVLINVIAIVILIIIGVVVGYLYFSGFFNKSDRFLEGPGQFGRSDESMVNNPDRNLQLNDSQIEEINSFFYSNPTQEQTDSYCQQNRMNCFYYCKNINSNAEYCKQLNSQGPRAQLPGMPPSSQ